MTQLSEMATLITNDPGFAGLAVDRLYPVTLPQEPVLPAATYLIVSRPHEHTHNRTELVWPRVQFDCYAGTYQEAHALAAAIDAIFGRWKLATGWPAFGEDERDLPEPALPPIGERFRVSLDITIWGLEV